MIIALSGRRVDAPGAETPRFPAGNVERVRAEVRRFFEEHHATVMVSSAACGADLIALSEAGFLGIQRKVVLPYARGRFRETSVTDRPGDWGKLYDEIMDEVESRGDVLMLNKAETDAPYEATNRAILSMTLALSNKDDKPAAGLLIWNGASRGKEDFTEMFGAEARELGLEVYEIKTV